MGQTLYSLSLQSHKTTFEFKRGMFQRTGLCHPRRQETGDLVARNCRISQRLIYPTHCNLGSVCEPGGLEQAASEKPARAAWLTVVLGDFNAY